MSSKTAMDTEVVTTEVPGSLKRLVRMVVRGFYTIEHVILMDMLIRNPCMKEDDLADLLQFERKQLRAVIAQLKNDRFVKVRLRMETGPDSKMTRQNYYYINYKVFVNVVKYKLDHMRRKIETEERDSTSRASFRCTECAKTFTDLEADQLCDFTTGEFRCSYCSAPVEEDQSALPKQDSRLLLARFNEQIEPLYVLLREVEDIKLAPEILEPEPTDVSSIKRDAAPANRARTIQQRLPGEHTSWSGDATRTHDYNLSAEQGITVNFADENSAVQFGPAQERKARPVWMTESTVLSSEKTEEDNSNLYASTKPAVRGIQHHQSQHQDDIMEALLAHERKTGAEEQPIIPGQASAPESETSESEEEAQQLLSSTAEGEVGEMESDEDEVVMALVAGEQVPLQSVTEEHVARMTAEEKEEYIKLGQEMYAHMYE